LYRDTVNTVVTLGYIWLLGFLLGGVKPEVSFLVMKRGCV
jgi:hypothetical protein